MLTALYSQDEIQHWWPKVDCSQLVKAGQIEGSIYSKEVRERMAADDKVRLAFDGVVHHPFRLCVVLSVRCQLMT